MKVAILTEGGRARGLGHVVRCLSLRFAFLESGAECEMFIDGDDALGSVMSGAPWRCLHWVSDAEIIRAVVGAADIVVIDSYLAAQNVYDVVAESKKLAMFFDDTRRLLYPCGYVVNASAESTGTGYPPRQGVKYCLGPDYICLRREFWDLTPFLVRPDIKRVFLSFGAVDSKNILGRVLGACVSARPDLTYLAVVGPATRKGLSLLEAYENVQSVEFLRDVSVNRLISAMQSVDVAVSSCGQTIYELAKTGVPSVTVRAHENQYLTWQMMVSSGAVCDGGAVNETLEGRVLAALQAMQAPSLRQVCQDSGCRLVDGQGARRIVSILLKGK
ncbi:MAG: hypothetical protein Q7K98_03995 [Candidatus Omnitrophota bacterium]|nr:hypothetical protein [Candidatus Omnitrophota bacterium]